MQVVDTIPIVDYDSGESVKPIKLFCFAYGGTCKIQVSTMPEANPL